MHLTLAILDKRYLYYCHGMRPFKSINFEVVSFSGPASQRTNNRWPNDGHWLDTGLYITRKQSSWQLVTPSHHPHPPAPPTKRSNRNTHLWLEKKREHGYLKRWGNRGGKKNHNYSWASLCSFGVWAKKGVSFNEKPQNEGGKLLPESRRVDVSRISLSLFSLAFISEHEIMGAWIWQPCSCDNKHSSKWLLPFLNPLNASRYLNLFSPRRVTCRGCDLFPNIGGWVVCCIDAWHRPIDAGTNSALCHFQMKWLIFVWFLRHEKKSFSLQKPLYDLPALGKTDVISVWRVWSVLSSIDRESRSQWGRRTDE